MSVFFVPSNVTKTDLSAISFSVHNSNTFPVTGSFHFDDNFFVPLTKKISLGAKGDNGDVSQVSVHPRQNNTPQKGDYEIVFNYEYAGPPLNQLNLFGAAPPTLLPVQLIVTYDLV